jgi:hypothetical protein
MSTALADRPRLAVAGLLLYSSCKAWLASRLSSSVDDAALALPVIVAEVRAATASDVATNSPRIFAISTALLIGPCRRLNE